MIAILLQLFVESFIQATEEHLHQVAWDITREARMRWPMITSVSQGEGKIIFTVTEQIRKGDPPVHIAFEMERELSQHEMVQAAEKINSKLTFWWD